MTGDEISRRDYFWLRSRINGGKLIHQPFMEALPHISPFVQSVTNCLRHLSYTTTEGRHIRREHLSIYLLLFKDFIAHHTSSECPSTAVPFQFVNTYFVKD